MKNRVRMNRDKLIEVLRDELTYHPTCNYNATYHTFDNENLEAIADTILELEGSKE